MTLVAGVDLGGTGCRVAVADGGYIPSDGRLDLPSCPITPEGMAHHITTALTQLSSFGTPEVLCIGTTGYPEILTEPELLAARLFDTTGLNGLILASDCLTMHVGALGGVAGTVVAAGTGVVTLGTDFDQNWHRVDGWGYLLGDDGSGAWIGRHGLSAALRAYDGRGGSQTLLNLLLENYESIDDAIYRIYDTGTPGRQVAKFAPVVATAAQQGDPLAISIWEQAGQHLAESIAAAHAVVPGAVSWGEDFST